jgi:CNT family concentrative nucleoside transporter
MLGYRRPAASFVFGDTLGGRGSGVFAFQVLPIIIFIASFAILYYLGVMQWVVKAFAIVMQK